MFIDNVLPLSFDLFTVIESQRPANKRRKRKGSQGGGAANSTPPVPNKKRSPGPNFSLASQVCFFCFNSNYFVTSYIIAYN